MTTDQQESGKKQLINIVKRGISDLHDTEAWFNLMHYQKTCNNNNMYNMSQNCFRYSLWRVIKKPSNWQTKRKFALLNFKIVADIVNATRKKTSLALHQIKHFTTCEDGCWRQHQQEFLEFACCDFQDMQQTPLRLVTTNGELFVHVCSSHY